MKERLQLADSVGLAQHSFLGLKKVDTAKKGEERKVRPVQEILPVTKKWLVFQFMMSSSPRARMVPLFAASAFRNGAKSRLVPATVQLFMQLVSHTYRCGSNHT